MRKPERPNSSRADRRSFLKTTAIAGAAAVLAPAMSAEAAPSPAGAFTRVTET